MAVILKYEIEEGGYYDVLDTDYIKPGQNYYDHVIGTEYRKPKSVEVEYEPTDEEYAWCLSCVGSWGLTKEELKEIGEEKLKKIAAAIIEAYPGIKDLMDKDEEFANELSFQHDLEEFE